MFMSFILDALRKSEQQRQSSLPDKIEDRLMLAQPEIKSSRFRIHPLLIVANLAALVGMAWFIGSKTNLGTPGSLATKPQTVANSVVSAKPSKMEVSRLTDNGTNATPSKPTASIAQLLKAEEEIAKESTTEKRDRHPLTAKSTAVKANAGNSEKSRRLTPKIASNRTIQPEANTSFTPEVTDIASPKMNINVLGYTEKPEDRFVVIDMIKYRTGQTIKDGYRLKEIHSGHIVLDNGHQSVIVDRP